MVRKKSLKIPKGQSESVNENEKG